MSGSGSRGGGRSAEELSQEILDYLLLHPNAMDTLEGIASFWLTGERPVSRARLAEVVENLVATERLDRVRTAGATSYRLRRTPDGGGGADGDSQRLN